MAAASLCARSSLPCTFGGPHQHTTVACQRAGSLALVFYLSWLGENALKQLSSFRLHQHFLNKPHTPYDGTYPSPALTCRMNSESAAYLGSIDDRNSRGMRSLSLGSNLTGLIGWDRARAFSSAPERAYTAQSSVSSTMSFEKR